MANVIEPIDRVIGQFIKDKKMYVLRNAKTGQALNASYSEEGLKYTTSPNGKLMYFKDAKLVREWDTDQNGVPFIVSVGFSGNLDPNPDVIVEQFIPKNHSSARTQIAEYTAVSKAYRLLYHTERS